MAQTDKIAKVTELLQKGVEDIFTSGKFEAYLKTMSRFHTYSFRNSLLIHLQNPNATRVAGFNTWKSFDRTVSRGAKGIAILAPLAVKEKVEVTEDKDGKPLEEPQTEETVRIKGFRIVYVFDVSQTHGKELPTIAKRLDGKVDNFETMFGALKKQAPFPVYIEPMEDMSPDCNGYCSYTNRKIVIREGLSQQHTIKTLVHETAHALYHDTAITDIETAEVEAESVAFVVCERLGIDTSDYSFGYIAGWSGGKDSKTLALSMDNIQKASEHIISETERELELSKEKIRYKEPLEKRTERAIKKQQELTVQRAKELVAEAQKQGKDLAKLGYETLLMANYERE